MWPFLYRSILYPLLRTSAQIVARKQDKLKDTLEGKRSVWERLPEKLAHRNPERPLVWFHAPSAGEFLKGQSVIQLFLSNNFDCIISYSSNSAKKWLDKTTLLAPHQPVCCDYLPFDTPREIQRWISTWQPVALIFIQYDLWPNVIWESFKAKIPIYLISATLQPKSIRFSNRFARSLYGNLYACFTGILAVSEEDKNRFLQSNPSLTNIEVFGDTRFDNVIERRNLIPTPDLPKKFFTQPVFIVGSCWPKDEVCIFPALKEALEQYPELLLIIAPHEPTQSHLEGGELYFKDFKGLGLSKIPSSDSKMLEKIRVIFVDSIGVLSAIYRVGNIGYVGGGFTTGVHNVMEPCAMGLPVAVGPKYHVSPEAVFLKEKGSLFPVSTQGGFKKLLFDLLENPSKCKQLGDKVKNFIESQCGASQRCYQKIVKEIR